MNFPAGSPTNYQAGPGYGENMKLSYIIALAKQGYTKNDIKELIALGNEETETPVETAPTEPALVPVTEQEYEEAPAAADQESGAENTETAEKINKLESQLKAIQEQNTRRPRPEEAPQKSDADIIKDMARRFM
jgi:DNA-binding transcriptional MerR regulator